MARAKVDKLPKLRPLPIYVQYVYIRTCRRNPSFERFRQLTLSDRNRLMAELEQRAKTKAPRSKR